MAYFPHKCDTFLLLSVSTSKVGSDRKSPVAQQSELAPKEPWISDLQLPVAKILLTPRASYLHEWVAVAEEKSNLFRSKRFLSSYS
jgi:hypothetical protein